MAKEIIKNEELVEQVTENAPKSKAEEYDEQVEKFTAEVEKINDISVLEGMEKDVIAEQEVAEKELAEKIYEIDSRITFDGTTYRREKVYEFIYDFLNKMEMNWQMSLTMYEFIKWWKNAAKENIKGIPYEYYDVTRKILGQQKYSGFFELQRLLVVNTMFEATTPEYSDDLALTYFLAAKHEAVIKRIEAINALNTPIKNEKPANSVKKSKKDKNIDSSTAN